MNPERAQFLFGVDDPGFDVDDEGEIIAFFEHELIGAEQLTLAGAAMRAVAARQVLLDEPPEAWQTVQRLRALGLDRADIIEQLAFAVMHEVHLVLAEVGGDDDRYASSLTGLPLPKPDEVASALESIVSREQGVSIERARDAVLDGHGRSGDDELADHFFDAVMDRNIEDGALQILAPDRLVHAPTLTNGIVLTHRVNEAEVEVGTLSWVGSDLAGFAWCDALSSVDGSDIEVFSLDFGHVGWLGPEAWLADHTVDDLLAVRVDDGVVRIDRLQTEPAPDELLVARLRALYEAEIDESGLPLLCEELVYAVLVDEPATFDQPRPPFSELCEAAGLEVRGGLLGHDASVWHEEKRAQRFMRVHDLFDDDDRAHTVLDALEIADDPDATNDDVRGTLSRFLDDEIFWAVLNELVDRDDAAADDVATARDFAARLVEVARTPTERMTAHFVAGIVDERAGDVVLAEAHFGHALDADPEWGPLVDRVAWYASDRGDARRAVSLWRLLESPDEVELRVVEASARRLPAKRGRNDPCWCGSGRKLKTCHGDTPEPIPLPDRVEWLATKAVGFLLRHGGEAEVDIYDLAIARAVEPEDPDSVLSALDDPLVLDIALTELGWFEQFLDERGPLLPDDEAALVASWDTIDRTVYEIEEVRPGDGVVVRDLRTGEQLDVRERTFSAEAEVGQQICARAVPDGVTHQIIGAVFLVAPGQANDVLELCDNDDAFGLCRYVAESEQPRSDVDDR